MTVQEIATKVAKASGTSVVLTKSILEEAFSEAISALANGEDFSLGDIGKLTPVARAARKARNPLTGASIDVPAKTVVKLKMSKFLKDTLKTR